ncbi:MAG: ATP-binding protein, partial [Chloroflexia bacterium]|nr:ATP-binding protein [Chloroflexia bacterium]
PQLEANQSPVSPSSVLVKADKPITPADREGPSGTHGLGLAIAREVVDAHNGILHVESEAGHGTTFVVEVPLVEETA